MSSPGTTTSTMSIPYFIISRLFFSAELVPETLLSVNDETLLGRYFEDGNSL